MVDTATAAQVKAAATRFGQEATTVTVAFDAAPAENRLLLAHIGGGDSLGAITVGPGWHLVRSGSGLGVTGALAARVADGTAADRSVTWTWTTPGAYATHLVETGCDAASAAPTVSVLAPGPVDDLIDQHRLVVASGAPAPAAAPTPHHLDGRTPTSLRLGPQPVIRVYLDDRLVWGGAAAVATAAQKLGVISYFYPLWWNEGDEWGRVTAGGPDVVGATIINPDSGPGTASNADYVRQVDLTQAAGIPVLGYVPTTYGVRPAADVKADVDRYVTWYDVDGIFFDEADDTSAGVAYYADLHAYVKGLAGRERTVTLNPGTATVEEYAAIADHLMVFEDTAAAYRTRTAPAWEADHPASLFWHAIHTTSAAELDEILSLSRDRNASLVWVTDDVMTNPYDTLPSYWSDLVLTV